MHLVYLNSLSFLQSKITFLRWWNRVILYAAYDFLSVVSQGNNEIQYLCTKSHLIFLSSSGALEAFVMFADLYQKFHLGVLKLFSHILTFEVMRWALICCPDLCNSPRSRFQALEVALFKAYQEWHVWGKISQVSFWI